MKCISALAEKEKVECTNVKHIHLCCSDLKLGVDDAQEADLIILGGLSGRLDQTVHTLSFLHKLRRGSRRIFAITDDSIAWILNEVRSA